MFCGKCGAVCNDGAKFCPACGAPVGGGTPAAAEEAKTSFRTTGIIAAAVAVVLIAVILIVSLHSCGKKEAQPGGDSCADLVNKACEMVTKFDAEGVFDLIPDRMIDYTLRGTIYSRDERDDMIADLNSLIGSRKQEEESARGGTMSMTYKVWDYRDVTDRDLENLQASYERYGVKVTAAKTAEVDFAVSYGGEKCRPETVLIPAIQCGGRWYLDMLNIGDLSDCVKHYFEAY